MSERTSSLGPTARRVRPGAEAARRGAGALAKASIPAAAGVGGVVLALRTSVRRARLDPGEPPPPVPPGTEHRFVGGATGSRLHLLELGAGRPVLFLHGVTLAATIWSGQLAALAGDFRVLALDLTGHGRSEAGPGTLRLDGVAADVVAVLETLGLEDVVLVGHSMGGMAALSALLDSGAARERVGALALLATSGGPMLPGPLWPAVARGVGVLAAASTRDRGRPAGPIGDGEWFRARLPFGRRPSSAQVEEAALLARATPPATLEGLVSDILAFDRHARLSELQLPAAVLVGTHDRLTPPRHARALAAGLVDARLEELPGAGHLLMWERPAAVEAMLRRLAARA